MVEKATQSQDYFECIINTIREPFLVLDQDLRVVTASRSFYDFFKVAPKGTVGRLIYDLGDKQWDIPKLRRLLETILPQQTSFDDYEVEHDFDIIGRRTMLLNGRQIEQEQGEERIILLAIEDITERKEIESGLEKTRKELAVIKKSADEAHEFAESVINTVREPLISLDQALRVVSVSRSFYDFFKVTPGETVGRCIYDLGDKQWDIPKLRKLLETILPQKTSFNDYEVEHDFTTIGRRTMLLNARQIEREPGKERIILLAIEDITERKQLEKLLSESEERFRRLFETANDGILLLEKREMKIRHANPAITAMLGYSNDECTGKNNNDIGILRDIGTCEEVMQALNKDGIIYYKDVAVQAKAGQIVDTDIYMVDRARLIQCNIRDITDRKKTENKLRKSEDHLRTLVQTIPDLIWSKNKDGVYLSCNSMFERFFGAKEEDIIERTDYSFVDRKLADSFAENDRRAMAAMKPTINEEWVTFADDGHRALLETIKTPLYNDSGILIGVLGIGRDITARKQAEETLRASEAKIQSILDNIGIGVALISPDMEVLELNHQMRKWFPEIDVGQRSICYRVFNDPPYEVICENCPTCKTLRDGLVHEYARQTHQAKGTRTYRIVASPIFKASGEVAAAVEMVEDITKRKQAEMDLRMALIKAHDEKAMSETVIASMGQGLSVMDTEFNILYQNDFQKDLVGDHTGEHCYMAIENIDSVCHGCPVAMAFKEGGVHKVERSLTTPKGPLHVEITASSLRDIDGKIVAGIEIVRDLTEQKKLEAQLRHSQKMEAIGTLAGGIAHDFNNILNVIMGYGEIVMESLEAGSPAKEDMQEVLTAAKRAVYLTRRLLVFSRKQVIAVESTDLNELLRDLQKMLKQIVRESTDLTLDLSEQPLRVMADAGQLEQVLINLASNARDAMPDGGRLTINTGHIEIDDNYVAANGYGKPGTYAFITVADTGQGMDAETQKKIFEPFFTTKEIGQGTGLGLAISYGIINQHDGHIKVYSEPGEGSVFKIFLPLCEEAVSATNMQKAAVSIKRGNETILVAEDDASLRKFIRITLESFGYEVITADDGEEAIEKFKENSERIDIVLLDMIMPKKNGKEVSDAIRKIRPGMKIFFASGYTMDVIKTKQVMGLGFDFIHKPFQSKDLLIKVREILDR